MKNAIYDRYCFYQRCQESSETFFQFLEDVRRLAKACGFESQEESLIRDRIIFGVVDVALREKFMQDGGDPSLEDVINVCGQLEKRISAEKDDPLIGEGGAKSIAVQENVLNAVSPTKNGKNDAN